MPWPTYVKWKILEIKQIVSFELHVILGTVMKPDAVLLPHDRDMNPSLGPCPTPHMTPVA